MKRKGFTLIELLIVVAIIGILAAIAVPNFLNAQQRARYAQVISNMKALSTAMMTYQTDWTTLPLHHPAHVTNIWGNALTTPVAYIASEPIDIYQSYANSQSKMYGDSGARPVLHPEPFYTVSAGAYGHPALDGDIPAPGTGNDLTLRFIDAPELRQKALSQYKSGRYIVSIGPDMVHNYPGTYNITNGLMSSGDIIWVIP
ncbi:MAG: prepilin-type N-terminal cleavage/methylation domain-containing protein [bacterium]|jgi:prepilin-type N-terminal cleavage/methylation domain-containing protein|nr:prepilin-type N-terminal cleavage/methylation domain-containing protein [bacterium]